MNNIDKTNNRKQEIKNAKSKKNLSQNKIVQKAINSVVNFGTILLVFGVALLVYGLCLWFGTGGVIIDTIHINIIIVYTIVCFLPIYAGIKIRHLTIRPIIIKTIILIQIITSPIIIFFAWCFGLFSFSVICAIMSFIMTIYGITILLIGNYKIYKQWYCKEIN